MNEEQNILEQLKNRQRASVPQRTDSLISETDPPTHHSPSTTHHNPTTNSVEDLHLKLQQFPKTKRRSAIVIEEDIDSHLSQYCRSQQITVETFLEAAWTISQSHQSTLNKITKEARKRYKTRKEAGRLRRLITMLSKE